MPHNEMYGQPYAHWLTLDRVVRAGQKAAYYLTNAERSVGVALFTEAQTEPLVAPDLTGLSEVVTADEWRNRHQHRPRIRARQVDDALYVWVGSNRAAIDLLRARGWHYDRRVNRWVHADRELDRFREAMEAEGYEVVTDA